jgi:DNA-binding NarL/FixJ family response regulator
MPTRGSVAEAENGSVLFTVAEARRWDLCILDIKMLGLPGTGLLHTLRRLPPAVLILVFSMYPEV